MKKILATAITLLFGASIGIAQNTAPPGPSPTPSTAAVPGPATVEEVVVQSQELDISREAIVPSLGATRYTVGPDRLDSQAQGENAQFNETILRFPGVAQDSFGQLHVRGEHCAGTRSRLAKSVAVDDGNPRRCHGRTSDRNQSGTGHFA